MGQTGPALKLVSRYAPDRAGREPEDQDRVSGARSVRHDLLKEWMGSHTRILGFWLDRLLEEGDEDELVSMIHRQYAWLSMMQARIERG